MNNDRDSDAIRIQIKALNIFALYVADNEELQKLAMDSSAVMKLSNILFKSQNDNEESENDPVVASRPGFKPAPKCNVIIPERKIKNQSLDKRKEATLMALAAISSLKEDCRKQVIEANLLPTIVKCLGHPLIGIRAAACHCTRSLSRSVKNLRTNLVDAGVALPLFKLLSDDSLEVQISASATLCNIVLDFSPMKKIVLEHGGVGKLVSLLGSSNEKLRLNAIWAIKNLVYQAETAVKASVIKDLGWAGLQQLINDKDVIIQEQALNLLRNIACGKEWVI